MLTVAATEYCVDQNQPSDPYLLELDCSENPSRNELLTAVVAAARRLHDKDPGADAFEPNLVTSDTWGDIGCEYDNDTWLFVGLPERLKSLLTA